ncbi:hypothetical protein D9M69_601260 [compost metagenome]
MQVENQISVAGLLQQQAEQTVELRRGCRHCIDGFSHRAANQPHIGACVRTKATLKAGRNHLGEFREITIEVLPTGEIEAALMGGLDHLSQPDRVRHRYQFDHSAESALLLQFAQTALELHGHAHPG